MGTEHGGQEQGHHRRQKRIAGCENLGGGDEEGIYEKHGGRKTLEKEWEGSERKREHEGKTGASVEWVWGAERCPFHCIAAILGRLRL